MQAPSEVPPERLRELHIRLALPEPPRSASTERRRPVPEGMRTHVVDWARER